MECLIENLICTWDSPLGIISKIVLSLQPENKEYLHNKTTPLFNILHQIKTKLVLYK